MYHAVWKYNDRLTLTTSIPNKLRILNGSPRIFGGFPLITNELITPRHQRISSPAPPTNLFPVSPTNTFTPHRQRINSPASRTQFRRFPFFFTNVFFFPIVFSGHFLPRPRGRSGAASYAHSHILSADSSVGEAETAAGDRCSWPSLQTRYAGLNP